MKGWRNFWAAIKFHEYEQRLIEFEFVMIDAWVYLRSKQAMSAADIFPRVEGNRHMQEWYFHLPSNRMTELRFLWQQSDHIGARKVDHHYMF